MNRRSDQMEPVVTMHVTDEKIAWIRSQLESERGLDEHHRKHPRVPYFHDRVLLLVSHPGGSNSNVLVWTRNISIGGVSVLLGAFVHPGTRVHIKLPCTDGSLRDTPGLVKWCRLVEGVVHEAGIQFDQETPLERFVNIAVLREDKHIEVDARMLEHWRFQAVDLLGEINGLIEQPRLNRAMIVCDELRRLGIRLRNRDLMQAANNALSSLKRTNSVARSEAALRMLQEMESQIY